MISAHGGLLAHRYTPQVTQRWPRGSKPASVQMPSWDGELANFLPWMRLFLRWVDCRGTYFPPDLLLYSLLPAMPEKGDYCPGLWEDRAYTSKLDFYQLFPIICHVCTKDADPDAAMTRWSSQRLPHQRLTPEYWAQWFIQWLKDGAAVPGGIPMYQAHRQQMGVLLHHERYKGRTPGWTAMLNSIFESMAERGIRFSYLELYLFVMRKLEPGQAKYRARTEDYEKFVETPYPRHSGAFLQEMHVRNGEDEWQTEFDVWDEQAQLDAVGAKQKCNHCGKPGNTREKCILLHPELKEKGRKGKAG